MKITDEQKTKGIEIATGLKITVLYINDKGEFFTSENLAQLSVAGDKRSTKIRFCSSSRRGL